MQPSIKPASWSGPKQFKKLLYLYYWLYTESIPLFCEEETSEVNLEPIQIGLSQDIAGGMEYIRYNMCTCDLPDIYALALGRCAYMYI